MVLIRSGAEEIWRIPTRVSYSDEDSLQAWTEESLSLLSGNDHPSVVTRELRVGGRQRIDLVAVDSTGVITLVECKLRDNPDYHRDVIGQAFGYAAHLWRMSIDDFERAYETSAGAPLSQQLDERVVAGLDVVTFREAVATNLATGRFRILIIVDEITDEMKQIVQFLNHRTQDDISISVMELVWIVEGDINILLPVVFGETLQLHIERPTIELIDHVTTDLLRSVKSRRNLQRNIKSKFFWRRFDVQRRSPEAISRVETALTRAGLKAQSGTQLLGSESLEDSITVQLSTPLD